MEWTRAGLAAAGFQGFSTLADLDESSAPPEPGVYAVLRPSVELPVFRAESPAGKFKGKDPTVPVTALAEAWVPGVAVLYLGKAGGRKGLSRRLGEYRRHGSGRRVGHWGGRFIWQLVDSADLLVAWKATPDTDPEQVEAELIAAFVSQYGQRPFANRKLGRSATGISNSPPSS